MGTSSRESGLQLDGGRRLLLRGRWLDQCQGRGRRSCAKEGRRGRGGAHLAWHADRPLPAAALDAALLDYNIFNCCLLRDLLAAAAQGYGSVLAVLV